MTSTEHKVANTLPFFSIKDYSSFFLAGAICCTLTHGALTPLDVIKTRIQIDPQMKGMNLYSGGKNLISNQGAKVLLTGFGPTAVGYLVQGGAKFAGYEYWKRKLVAYVGVENAVQYKTPIYLAGAAIAEFFADILLTPLEATRIRLVSNPKYATGLLSGFSKIAAEGGLSTLYAGFIPILAKQIPYALGQFTVNELAHEQVVRIIGKEKKKNLTAAQGTTVTLGCGVVAGVAAAVLSHPADTLLSQINKGAGKAGQSNSSKMVMLAKEAGVSGLFAGLGPRIVMTCFLVSGQFLLYDWVKAAVSAPHGIDLHVED